MTRYTIERDERGIGGEMIVLRSFEDWESAEAAFLAFPEPPEEGVCVWLNEVDGDSNCACLCKGDLPPDWIAWCAYLSKLQKGG